MDSKDNRHPMIGRCFTQYAKSMCSETPFATNVTSLRASLRQCPVHQLRNTEPRMTVDALRPIVQLPAGNVTRLPEILNLAGRSVSGQSDWLLAHAPGIFGAIPRPSLPLDES